MFWLDLFLSLMLPFVFLGTAMAVATVVLHRATLDAGTIERIKRKNPVLPHERHEAPRLMQSRRNRGWESAFDSEVQRLRRKSLGLD